jgi:hypothetical protein
MDPVELPTMSARAGVLRTENAAVVGNSAIVERPTRVVRDACIGLEWLLVFELTDAELWGLVF